MAAWWTAPPLLLLLLLSGAVALSSGRPASLGLHQHPQYLLVNKAQGSVDADAWDFTQPSTCTTTSILNVTNSVRLGNATRMPLRRLGISFQFNVMDPNTAGWTAFLARFLQLAVQLQIPIGITLDAFEFWESRTDLYNHWNASLPGYQRSNCFNVEWTGWQGCPASPSPPNASLADDAVRIAWRNWGDQFRVAPHPNLASEAVLEAYRTAMAPGLAMVGAWYATLPATQKYLLAYLKPSWETWIGTNYFLYPNASSYLPKPPAEDPTTGIKDSVQVGYASVCSLLKRCSGGPPTSQELDAVTTNFFQRVGSWAAAAGLPRSKVLVHAGGNQGQLPPTRNNVQFNSPRAALNNYTLPGWSIYHYAYNPGADSALLPALAPLNGSVWGASEWYYYGGNAGSLTSQWYQAFNNTLGLHNNRLVDVFNWESLRQSSEALQALQQALNDPPACLVDAVANLSCTRTPTAELAPQACYRFAWTAPAWAEDNVEYRLAASSQAQVSVAGDLLLHDLLDGVPVSGAAGSHTACFSAAQPALAACSVTATGCWPPQRMVVVAQAT